MTRPKPLKKLVRNEEGSFASTAILLVIVFAVMAIAIIDGSSVFYAYRAANDVTEEAAANASAEFKLYRNDYRAQETAIQNCQAKGLEFIEISKDLELGSNAYSVTCEKDAETYVFKYLPALKDLTHQQVTSTSYSSY